MARDPVCGIEIDEKKAAGKSEYKGQTYYFCSPGYKESFDKEPAKYVGKAQPQAQGSWPTTSACWSCAPARTPGARQKPLDLQLFAVAQVLDR